MSKITLLKILLIFLIISCFGVTYKFYFKRKNALAILDETTNVKKDSTSKEIYVQCLTSPYQSDTLENNIQQFLNTYKEETFSLYFNDLNNNYIILKNPDIPKYGASLIKLLECLYLLKLARLEKIDLNTTITYERKNQRYHSLGMKNHIIGEEISLKKLIFYAISISDNTAHEMLFNYITSAKLKEYAKSINFYTTISEYDHYGNVTAIGTDYLLKEVYTFLDIKDEYSEILKQAMNNDYYNSLNLENTLILHKYGLSGITYNDIGIYDNVNAYTISILTDYGNDNYYQKIQEIHQKINEIYSKNIQEKKAYCLAKTRVC